jgi:predicted transposase YdaD
MEEGRQEGRIEGRQEGRQEGQTEAINKGIQKALQRGKLSAAEIAEDAEVTVAYVMDIQAAMNL